MQESDRNLQEDMYYIERGCCCGIYVPEVVFKTLMKNWHGVCSDWPTEINRDRI